MENTKWEKQGLISKTAEMVWEGVMKLMRGIGGSSPDHEEGLPPRFGFSSMRKDLKPFKGYK